MQRIFVRMPNDDSDKLDYFYTIMCSEEGTPSSHYCDEAESREEGPVWKALLKLKEEDREMMLMRASDLKPREIAEEVGMDPGVVYTRLCRAKKELQRILKNVA